MPDTFETELRELVGSYFAKGESKEALYAGLDRAYHAVFHATEYPASMTFEEAFDA